MTKKLLERLKHHLEEVLELKRSPHSIAMGFALGTLIAILPTFGLGVFLGLGLLLIFKKVSKISLLLAFVVWNPLVLALMYPFNYLLGNYVLPGVPIRVYKLEILNQLFIYSRRFIIGSIISAILISIICYGILLIIVYKYQKKKARGIKEELIKAEETLEI